MMKKLPNIILMVLDTVGAKHLSLYGYHRRTSPNLERIAEECTVYRHCFAPGCWTIPSHASMFTGLYPSQHGAHENSLFLDANLRHITTVLKMLGYHTLGISSNPIVVPSTVCPGFDSFRDFGVSVAAMYGFVDFLPARDSKNRFINLLRRGRQHVGHSLDDLRRRGVWGEDLWKLYLSLLALASTSLRQNPIYRSSHFTEITVSLFRDFLAKQERQPERPFFLFINLLEAHEYFRPPLKWRRFSSRLDKQLLKLPQFFKLRSPAGRGLAKVNLNLYDDEIRYLDDAVGRMWDIFKSHSLADNTVFIITSDHGEHFGEKGRYEHQLSLYNELLWVPLLIRFPAHFRGPGWEDRLVSLNDLYATILDLVASPLPRPDSSLSLLDTEKRDLAVSQIILPERWLYVLNNRKSWENDGVVDFPLPLQAVITAGGKKIIENLDASVEVYELGRNLTEDINLFPGMPAAAKEHLAGLLAAIQQETQLPEAREAALRQVRSA